ncbi:tetratricopeptide repeat protein [Campylobacter mucosalis]|uniref:Tetratricopeptide repeat protein n=1 Tax=Campylobacter mucosalis CCUG 21559 TaxID=1032067 RepID=A0A6G5QHF7_9BACT|nr:hypothetical protein [Campylobacter mucosalis]QCD45133.1 tetratricopeptide repeat protein [Campylobacter mucosalis CCUG 21559]
MYWRKIFIVISILITFLSGANASQSSENLEILKALNHLQSGNFKQSISIYEKLYSKTKQKAYIKEAINVAFMSNDMSEIRRVIKFGAKYLKDDPDYDRARVAVLLSDGKMQEAREILKNLIKNEENAKNYMMLGNLEFFEKNDKEAALNFKKAYELNSSEKNVINLAKVLILRKENTTKAIEYLNDFKDKNGGCTIDVCMFLADLYLRSVNNEKLAPLYEEIYSINEDEGFLVGALMAYAQINNKDGFYKLISSHKFDDEILLQAYAQFKDYQNAYDTASRLLQSTQEPKFGAFMAIYAYEKALPKPDKKTLEHALDLFEKYALKSNEALFLNYYGYLLIDENIDYKKGIELVKKALAIEPNSPYYIDSLAWGYYKLGDCKLAKEYMQKANSFEEFKNEIELLEHTKAIDECLKKGAK